MIHLCRHLSKAKGLFSIVKETPPDPFRIYLPKVPNSARSETNRPNPKRSRLILSGKKRNGVSWVSDAHQRNAPICKTQIIAPIAPGVGINLSAVAFNLLP